MAAGGIAIAALVLMPHTGIMIESRTVCSVPVANLGRVGITDTEGLREGFYAFRKGIKRDATNYEGMYAKNVERQRT